MTDRFKPTPVEIVFNKRDPETLFPVCSIHEAMEEIANELVGYRRAKMDAHEIKGIPDNLTNRLSRVMEEGNRKHIKMGEGEIIPVLGENDELIGCRIVIEVDNPEILDESGQVDPNVVLTVSLTTEGQVLRYGLGKILVPNVRSDFNPIFRDSGKRIMNGKDIPRRGVYRR
jgi:hypothetical protein